MNKNNSSEEDFKKLDELPYPIIITFSFNFTLEQYGQSLTYNQFKNAKLDYIKNMSIELFSQNFLERLF